MINESKTFELYGYTSDSLSKESHKLVVRVCEGCGEIKNVKFGNYNNSKNKSLCPSCALIHRHKPIKPEQLEEKDRYLNDGAIDRILTIEKYGYDPVDLGKRSDRCVIRVCQHCGKIDEKIIFGNYSKGKHSNLCGLCGKREGSKKIQGIKRSDETKQKIRDNTPYKYGKDHPNYKPKIIITCIQCGITKKVKPFQRNLKFCSCNCRDKWNSVNRCGENHPSWNPDLTEKDRLIGRNNPEIRQWRKDVYRRDNHTCQICGDKGYLNAHHIESYNSNPELRTALSNGTTLCKNCHTEFHNIYGRGNNTQSQLNEFILIKNYELTN